MVSILPPDSSLTFVVLLLIPLVIGFFVGVIAKSAIKIGVAIAIIAIILIAIGIITPNQVVQPLVALIESGAGAAVKVEQITGFLPYSLITFIVGLVIGYLKS
jgi:uncharacterized protein YqfA (UPF0365 family)